LQSRQNLLDTSCLGGSFPEQQAIQILFGSKTCKTVNRTSSQGNKGFFKSCEYGLWHNHFTEENNSL